MLALPTILILNPILDHIVKGKDVPSVVSLGLHLTFSSILESCLCKVDNILFVCRTKIDLLSAHAGGARRRAALPFGLNVHGSMRNW